MSDARVRAVVFDLDGTLIDSRSDIAGAVNHALTKHGRAPLPEAEIGQYVGDGARALLSRAARLPLDAPELSPVLADFLDYYTAHATDHTRLFPGARETLAALSALPLALCTNKPRATTDLVVRALLPGAFQIVIAGGDGHPPKPDPACLQAIASELGVPVDTLVVIGDGPQDVLCARAAGARSIAVTGGFGTREALEHAAPTALVERLLDAVPLVQQWAR